MRTNVMNKCSAQNAGNCILWLQISKIIVDPNGNASSSGKTSTPSNKWVIPENIHTTPTEEIGS
jgi:hypothetical protein